MKKIFSFAAALLLACSFVRPAEAVDALSVIAGGAAEPAADTAASADQTAARDEIPQPYVPSAADAEACSKRLAEIERILAELESLKADEAAARFGVTAEDVTRRVENLTLLKNAYPRLINAIGRKKQDDADLARQKGDTSSPELTLNDKPPYKLSYYDSYIGNLDDIRKQIDDAKEGLARFDSYAAASQKLVEEREAAWRLARDNYQKEQNQKTSWQLQGAAYLLEIARAQLILDGFEKERAATALAKYELQYQRRGYLQKYIRENLDLSAESFAAQIAALNAEIKKLEDSRPALNRQIKQAEAAAETAEMKYAAVADDKDKGAAQLEMSYRTAERDRYRLQLEQLQETLVLYAERKRLWTLRYDLARGAVDETTIPAVVKNMNAEIRTLENNLLDVQKDLLSLQSRQSAISKMLDSETTEAKYLPGLKKYSSAVQASIDSCLSYTAAVISLSAQERAFAGELQETYKTVSTFDKIHAFWKTHAATLLNTELWQSGGYAVRLKEFLIALAIIVFGTWGARKLVHMFSWVVGKYFKFDETSRRTFDRFVFYLAGIAIFLTALHIVGIPLTAFAFLGGAVAIAIGFGAQNMFKNLMGGILLTLNRPFRLGDVIEVAGVSGTVTDLGVRSTLIRTFDEKEVVVPNSQLLDNQLINWSLSDALLRVSVDFGVEYGTPAKKVKDVVLRIADANPKILKNPAPWVYFADFGDSELNFSLYFWVNQKIASGMKVSGELREAIQEVFAQEGLRMAYPHMDVSISNAGEKQRTSQLQNL